MRKVPLFSNYTILWLAIFGLLLAICTPCKGYGFEFDNDYDNYGEERMDTEEEEDEEEFTYGDVYNFDEDEFLPDEEDIRHSKRKNKKLKSSPSMDVNPLSHRRVKAGLTTDDNGEDDTHYGSHNAHSKSRISSSSYKHSDSFSDTARHDEVETMYHKPDPPAFKTGHSKINIQEHYDYEDEHKEYIPHHVKEADTRRVPYAPSEDRYHITPSPPRHHRPILSKAIPIEDTRHTDTLYDSQHGNDFEDDFTDEEREYMPVKSYKETPHHRESVHYFRHEDQ